MEVTVHTRLDAVAAADWERLAAGRTPFHRLAWLAAAPPPGALRLLVARRGGETLGLLPLYLLDGERTYYQSPRQILCGYREEELLAARGRSTAALRAAAAAPWWPAALATVPAAYRGGVIGTANGARAAETAAALAAAASELCGRAGVRLLLYYGLREGDDDPLLAALEQRGRRAFVAGAHCDLEVVWPALDAYFATLGERGRRLRSRHRRAASAADRRWRVLTRHRGAFPSERAAAAAALFVATARRHGDADPPVSLYRTLLGEDRDGRVVSALLAIEDGGVLYPKLFGSRTRDDYFFLTYSRLLELAIARGVRRIAYGGGSHQVKLLRGAGLRWLLASLEVYDPRLATPLLDLVPLYQAAKVEHFSSLAARFAIDHTPPAPPVPPAVAPSWPLPPSPADVSQKGAPP